MCTPSRCVTNCGVPERASGQWWIHKARINFGGGAEEEEGTLVIAVAKAELTLFVEAPRV